MTIPIFDLKDHFDTTIAIGDAQLPIRVKRYSRAEMDAFEKKWAALIETPRGTAELTDEQKADRERQQLAFIEDTIREAVTLDAGLVRDRDKDVTDGAGLIGVFHARKDVLSGLLGAVYAQNRLAGVIRKNSSSPRASEPGSAPSTQVRGGDKPAPTVGSAGRSDSATAADATAASSSTPAAAPASSGELPKVH